MGNTQNKKDVQVRLEEEVCEPKPLMLLRYELLREFNFTPKMVDYKFENRKLKELYKMGTFPEETHPHLLLNEAANVQPLLTKSAEAGCMQKSHVNMPPRSGARVDDTQDQKSMKEAHK